MIASEQVPGIYRRRVGEVLVTALHDGGIVMPPEVRVGIAPAEQEAMQRASGLRPPFVGVINTFALQWQGTTVLVDAGCGPVMGPAAGRTAGNLRAAGIAPEDVDVVLMTHLHPDHVGGLLEGDGTPAYSRAQLQVSETEMEYWLSDAAKAAAPEPGKRPFDLARRNMAAYGGRTRRFAGGEVLPGIHAVPLPGHTPGHTGYMIESRGERLLIWADALNVPAIQAARPEVSLVFDVDPAQGIATRRAILERAVEEDLLVTGMHLPFPGFSRIARSGDGFVVQPEPWSLLAPA